ncbi:DEAD/DEAH box helicase [Actinomadura macrotermitis]|uniref:RNA polymerase-associated protein RapA n=1 Tax=Actinomadura macrotermitis TaxID=2585200 RepID=A0A7K0BMZ6_9ACTN|nr:SNF2-related protein [Actinomadura macrotermitis]MQY02545.1 RNA polymerase-associated protein RapA [Actinomadura macrotermitis]
MAQQSLARRGPAGPRELLREAHGLLDAARTLQADDRRARAQVHRALEPLRDEVARARLAEIPLSRLKDVTGGRLRLGPLEAAGFGTALDVLDATPYRLQLLPGVGPQTAQQLHAAARQLHEAAQRTAGVRVDVDRRDAASSALVTALHRVVNAGPDLPRARKTAAQVDERLSPLLADARPARSWWRRLVATRAQRDRAQAALAELAAALGELREAPLLLGQASVDLLRPEPAADVAWLDYELRAAEYQTQLAEIAAVDPDREAAEGFLPNELAEQVKAQPLDDAHLRVSLRGYQAFGARFALARRRVIIGDEMGLGKTVQALAALAHLRAEGATHFLVVCPASVLINWVREIEAHSALPAHPAHGSGRAGALRAWARDGGIAVTTLDSLHSLAPPDGVEVAMLVVDEAHYVKNPETRRSAAVAAWCGRVERVLFLTGTPMENRVAEFRNLVAHLRPELLPEIRQSDAALGPRAFRTAVAPVYLRRNQRDVLVELPDVVHVDEWEEFSAADARAYRRAVEAGNFMAMRRAAYADPQRSAKLRRVVELVGEASENDLKVVVFSYFRDVLAAVQDALGRGVHGPISGDVPAEKRQRTVDDFAAEPGHAVLLGQIQAGGVGLNLQAASVVILCEPQVKPSMEAQAVGRAHRMGQVRSVQVHRILTPGSVDQRMLEILRAKAGLFDQYARRSDLAEATADAVDVSEPSLALRIVQDEQERLAAGHMG